MEKNDEKIIRALANRLKELRQEKGLTQDELSTASGLSREQITRMEAATKNPSFLTLVSVAHALDISLSELVNFPIPKK